MSWLTSVGLFSLFLSPSRVWLGTLSIRASHKVLRDRIGERYGMLWHAVALQGGRRDTL